MTLGKLTTGTKKHLSQESENMARRTPGNQTKHDRKAGQIAQSYRRDNWYVKADISGYSQPSLINGRRPDVHATKQGITHIIEVETPDTVDTDKDQHDAFRRYANQRPNTEFFLKVTD